MEVARLRSCYSVPCVFFQDGTVGTLQWYFVPEGTPVLPFGTTFQSDFWSDVPEGESWPLGEVPGAVRTWTNGTAPYPVQGGPPCGTADQFANGDPSPRTPVLNVYGGLACCPLPTPPFVHFTCIFCSGGAWSDYTLRVTGFSGQLVNANGTYDLRYIGNCQWLSTTTFQFSTLTHPTCNWLLHNDPNRGWQINLFNGVDTFQWWWLLPNPWDCLAPEPTSTDPNANYPAGVGNVPQLFAGFQTFPLTNCVNLAATPSTLEFATLPVLGTHIQIRPVATTWNLLQVLACEWDGEMLWQPGTTSLFRVTVPTRLVVSAGGLATLTIMLSRGYTSFADLVYTSQPGWTGQNAVALLLASGSSAFVVAPGSITLTPVFP